jgi:signal transduction histidine kinase/ligand-binding sensor domain-containing protein
MAHMSWTRRDYAPNDIAALEQTKDGYLWIGSKLGLYRFDGRQFSPYPFTSADPRLPSSDIAALAADRNGGLWIGYRMGGITYLKGAQKIDYNQNNGLIGESTEQLVCRDDGSVWATADGRLMHLAGAKWENYSANHGLSSAGLYTLFFDRDGNLWTAEKGHVYELKRGTDRFISVALKNLGVNQFAQLPNGALWISDAFTNVRPLSDHSDKAVRIPGVPVMLVDNEGSIWLAHDFGGVTRIKSPGSAAQKAENYGTINGLTDGQTRTILMDRQGAIWVGTAQGLDRFQHSPLRKFYSVHLDYFPALVADKTDGILFNDMDKPLMHLQGGRLSFIGQPHGSSSLFQDDAGGVWLLDPIPHDLFRYPEDGGSPMRIPIPAIAREVETWCIGKDIDGAVLASFEGHGLWRYSGKWEPVSAPGLPKEAPVSLMRSKADRLWIGYPHNQIALEDRSGFHIFGAQQGLELNAVLTFYDAGNLILIGGSDGLAYYDGRRFHSLQLRAQNLLRGISGIVKDRFGDLWLNAAAGIIRLPAAEWKAALNSERYAMDFQLLNERDGVMGTPAQSKPTPSAVADKAGLLWFATSGHLVSIDPASVRTEDAAPNVLIQSVLINGSVVRYADGVPLTEDGRRLKKVQFEYIGVDLDAPDRVTYQYMLEPLEKEWQEGGIRGEQSYANVTPNNYRFRVRAASGTGRWSEMASPLQLKVLPAFYQTKWFYVMCTLSLGGLLWFLYHLRVRYLTAQMQEHLEARALERLRIARDLHDTLLQGVQGLVLRFHFATEQLRAEEPVREMLRTALSRADQVINEGREKVRELRERTSSRDLPEDLAQITDSLQAEGDTQISLLVEGKPRLLLTMVQEELCSIAREALSNAVRHSGATHIELKIQFDAKQLRLCCSDDGCGMDAAVLEAGFKTGHWGIVGMNERASRLGCKLEVRSAPGAGTKIEVGIPAKSAYATPGASPRERKFEILSRFITNVTR